jgi:membrane dipeptidase
MTIDNSNKLPVFDAHQDISDSMLYLTQTDFLKKNKLEEGKNVFELLVHNQTDFYRLKQANVRLVIAVSCVIHMDKDKKVAKHPQFTRELFRHIDLYYDLKRRAEGKIKIVKSRKDLEDWDKDNKLRFLLAVEGLEDIDENLKLIEALKDRGIRSISLTYNEVNALGGGCLAPDVGLTELGKKVIKKMNELGIVLDLAHIGEKSFFEALDINSGPVIVSHAGCKNIKGHFRNLTDKQIKAIAEKGGLLGICSVADFIGEDINDLAKHFIHVIELIGIERIVIGSDMGGMVTQTKLLKGFEEPKDFSNLFLKLKEAGLSTSDIEKIAYRNLENFLYKALV